MEYTYFPNASFVILDTPLPFMFLYCRSKSVPKLITLPLLRVRSHLFLYLIKYLPYHKMFQIHIEDANGIILNTMQPFFYGTFFRKSVLFDCSIMKSRYYNGPV
jgi:hypothetical protein